MRNAIPEAKPRPIRRLQKGATYGLGAGVAFAVADGPHWELVSIWGTSTLTVRIKTATAGGQLDIIPVGPDFDLDKQPTTTQFSALVGTIYTTGVASSVAVAATTEAIANLPCHGEGYALVKFTPSGTGTITYCDVCSQPIAGR